jgi:arylamine N-acetyltransferase
LALEADREQTTPHETFRLVPVGNEFDLQVRFGETWTDFYRLSLQEQFPPVRRTEISTSPWNATSTPPSPRSSWRRRN